MKSIVTSFARMRYRFLRRTVASAALVANDTRSGLTFCAGRAICGLIRFLGSARFRFAVFAAKKCEVMLARLAKTAT